MRVSTTSSSLRAPASRLTAGRPPGASGRRPRRLLGAAAAAMTTAALALPTPVWAHDTLVSSTPGDGQSVAQAPETVEMTFSADLLDVGTQVRVTDASGADVTDGQPTVRGTTVTQQVTAPESTDESYTVVWRVVSSDGHPIEGRFDYEVGDGAANQGAPAASSSAPATSEAASTPDPNRSVAGEATAQPEGSGQTDGETGGTPLWLFAGGGAVLALVVLAAVVAVRRIGGNQSDG